MTTLLLLMPAALSILVLGAHFLRGGHLLVVAGLLALIPLLAFRRRWVLQLVRVVLVVGALEWLRTLRGLAQLRAELGQPYLRMGVILGAVAAVTLASALLLNTRRLQRHYRFEPSGNGSAAR